MFLTAMASTSRGSAGSHGSVHEIAKRHRHHQKLLILSMVVVIAMLTLVAFSLVLFPDTGLGAPQPPASLDDGVPPTIEEKTGECVSENPYLTQEQCLDLQYYDQAIATNNPELCSKIKNGRLATRCELNFV